MFDNYGSGHNHGFTLEGAGGATSGSFTGTVDFIHGPYYAVYPYTEGAVLVSPEREDEEGLISGITLPSKQTAIKDSFDPKAALMIAESSDKKNLNFLNVVSLVKVTTDFACKRIVLNANEWIAGTGMLLCNDVNPSITFTSDPSKSIVLKPATEGDDIAAGTYYIAVKPGALTAGWSISFTSTDYNVYTRKSSGKMVLNRGKIRGIGTFNIASIPWTSTSRGIKVNASQEVDLGLTITQADGKKYRVIFAKSNLTTNGLAANESDYGDYYAWGAIEPWYSRITGTTVAEGDWKEGYTGGYKSENYTLGNDIYGTDNVLKTNYDAARQKLGGDWQIPMIEIWAELSNISNFTWTFESNGYKVTPKGGDGSKYIFLPAAGYFNSNVCQQPGEDGNYWSSSADSDQKAFNIGFNINNIYPNRSYSRSMGLSIRPVRLVEVDN